MPDLRLYARQWAAIVEQARLLGANVPGAEAVELGRMVASVVPSAPSSSLMNAALSVDPARPPDRLAELAQRFRAAGARKWGLWVDGDDEQAARPALAQGMFLDSRPAPMGMALDGPFAAGMGDVVEGVDLGTVGRINDRAYGYRAPKLEPAIARLPPHHVRTYGAHHQDALAAVAITADIGDDTTVWWVATLPEAQGNGLATRILTYALRQARERGQTTATLQASPSGKPLYERLGFRTVGSLHLYEQPLP
jgi:GNAT superfamily N-acetyltransferase